MLRKVWFGMISLALALTGTAAQAAPLELKFQSVYPPAQIQNVEILKPWAESIEKLSGGSMSVHFFPMGAIVEPVEAGHAVINGMLDIVASAVGSFPREYPYAYMTQLPFSTTSSTHGTNFYYDLYAQVPEFKADLDKFGHVLAMWASASYCFTSVKTPIRTPADIRGKRVLIIIPGDSVAVEAWGGVPVYVPPSDVYVGLQRGMGEVFYSGIPFQRGLRLMEVVKYITPLSSSTLFMLMAMNKDVYDELTPEQKKIIDETTGREFSNRISASLDKDQQDVLDLFANSGVEVINLTPAELETFQTAMKPLVDNYWTKTFKDVGVKGDIKAWIEKYYALSAAAAKE